MNLLAIIVLLALAWYSLESGMAFFAFLLVLAVILMFYTQKPESQNAPAQQSYASGQPVIIDSSPSASKGEVRVKVKSWKDRWDTHPQEYILVHAGMGLSNLMRSVLYMFGIEKDQKKD
jgi:hypothetical protein